MTPLQKNLDRLSQRIVAWQSKQRIDRLARQVAEQAQPLPDQPPVVFFNASTRLTGLSLNAAFALLTSWGLRLAGVPVKHFVCRSGMSHCVLGTNREDFTTPPPCTPCIAQSQRLYTGADVHWFDYQRDEGLASALQDLPVEQLSIFEYPLPPFASPVPLGRLVLPSIRWALRMHHLPDDGPTRYLMCEYILSAYSVAQEFARFIEQTRPQTAVIFNGMMLPEATVRWVARQCNLRTVAHEVGFQRYSTFFTEGEPTAYPIQIPEDFELTPRQNARLDEYLEKRFQGQFTMAGIRFWPEMHGLDEAFLEKAAHFRQIVPVFTNVVYDTSQVHANVVFPHMFAWLDLVLEIMRTHPETLFVIRAHPDEMRPGTAKQSRESVRDWVERNGVNALPNVIFIDSQEYISSYELIQRAKFVIVYNSSIGMEATLMGTAVLCGGKARYTQYPIVFFPATPQAYRQQAETFLTAGLEDNENDGHPTPLPAPLEFQRNARRFLYYQLYQASLPLEDFIQAAPRQGFVQLRPFSWQDLLPENSPTMQVLLHGILDRAYPTTTELSVNRQTDNDQQTFLMPEELD